VSLSRQYAPNEQTLRNDENHPRVSNARPTGAPKGSSDLGSVQVDREA
jgi:hypothetical protein